MLKGIEAFSYKGKELYDLKTKGWIHTMNILSYSYKKRGALEFTFDAFPHSKVVFHPIKTYYFIRTVRWNAADPVVTRRDLEIMEMVANLEMGTLDHYKKRKGYKPITLNEYQ